MRRAVVAITAVLMLAAAAQAVDLISHNPSVNNGGLNATGVWIKTGSGPDAAVNNDRNGPDGGDWNIGGSDGSGASPSYDVTYSQTFTLAGLGWGPGVYDIEMSGWCKAWAGWWSGENWNWQQEAHITLLVDGNVVSETWSGKNAFGQTNNWDTWTQASYIGQQTINNDIELRLRAVKGNDQYGQGGLGAIWFASRFDDIKLSVVPEPAGLMLLGLASVFLVRRRR